jgi:uncharacterized protein
MSIAMPFDTTAEIAALYVYPIKSCAGIALQECFLENTGLDLDRAWMVVDERGEFLSQRELPRMALIRPTLKQYEMVLRAPGMLALHITIDAVEKPTRATVWSDTVDAYDMGDLAAQWFTDFLGIKARLVRFNPEAQRLSNPQWTGSVQAPNLFSDGFPVLVLSQAALDEFNSRLQAAGYSAVGIERFRPNVVLKGLAAHDEDRLDVLHIATADGETQLKLVKPCPRCPIPNVDPETAVSHPAVGDILQSYRRNDVVKGAVTFGMNAIILQGQGQVLRVGQGVQADYRFE